MNKEQLFQAYGIEEKHNTWNASIDDFMLVDIYRIMNNGKHYKNGSDVMWIPKFLDKLKSPEFLENLKKLGADELITETAKRLCYLFHEMILAQMSEAASS